MYKGKFQWPTSPPPNQLMSVLISNITGHGFTWALSKTRCKTSTDHVSNLDLTSDNPPWRLLHFFSCSTYRSLLNWWCRTLSRWFRVLNLFFTSTIKAVKQLVTGQQNIPRCLDATLHAICHTNQRFSILTPCPPPRSEAYGEETGRGTHFQVKIRHASHLCGHFRANVTRLPSNWCKSRDRTLPAVKTHAGQHYRWHHPFRVCAGRPFLLLQPAAVSSPSYKNQCFCFAIRQLLLSKCLSAERLDCDSCDVCGGSVFNLFSFFYPFYMWH